MINQQICGGHLRTGEPIKEIRTDIYVMNESCFSVFCIYEFKSQPERQEFVRYELKVGDILKMGQNPTRSQNPRYELAPAMLLYLLKC